MNVVFDLGGVIFTWQPDSIIGSVFDDPESGEIVRREVFDHPDWLALDKGDLDISQAIEHAAKRTGLSSEDIATLMRQVPLSLKPIDGAVELVRSVKRSGNKVFVLSNMHSASIEHLEREYSIWNIFDGIVISCRIHMVKPEPGIFKYLLETYGLAADETVFIDDTDMHLEGASGLGIKTVKFINPKQCEYELKKIGCI